MTDTLSDDPRWRRLLEGVIECSSCGAKHHGLFDVAYGKPDAWPGSVEKSPNVEVLSARHVLTEDFCILDGRYFFIRSVLRLPIRGAAGAALGLGVWCGLMEEKFHAYVESFDEGLQAHFGSWAGRLSNRLRGYPDTLNLRVRVWPSEGRRRPQVTLVDDDHPLAREQCDGVTFERLLDLYAAHGHDLRPMWGDGAANSPTA
jgi:hypothetical protein